MIIIIFGIIIGVLVGLNIPFLFNGQYTIYISVGLLAAIDSIFGAIRANLEEKFEAAIFFSGFFVNAILAGVLAFIGDNLGLPLYYAALFVFGTRLFDNLAIIRRHLIKKYLS